MEDMLAKILGKENVFKDELLSKHCTFGIGGRSIFFITPTTITKLIESVKYLTETNNKWKIIGNGSNLLFQDEGFDGVIVSTLKIKDFHIFENGKVLVSAGVLLPQLVSVLADNCLTGLEFACSIPGTVGGALFMNAGAFGKCIADVVESVTYFNGDKLITARVQDLGYSYRDSLFKCNPEFVILSCELNLLKTDKVSIVSRIENFKSLRKSNQPTDKSAGSVFKSVYGVPAWKYIDGCGLRGAKIGGAEISSKHTNFIVNKGNASSKEVLELINLIENRVNEKYKKALELEIEVVK